MMLCNRFLKMRHRADKRKIFYFLLGAVVLVILLHPSRHAASTSYEYLHGGVGYILGIEVHSEYFWGNADDIIDNLHVDIAANFTSSSNVNCNYKNVINDDTTLSISLVETDLIEGHGVREGGEYAPQECVPSFSSAVLVPYRDRAEQLRRFLVYMHTFFRRQKIHYRIFVIEQEDTQPFNRAKLLNIGAVAAMKAGFPCLILHDVDLLPLRPANIYACTQQPRHMSANIDKNRFVLSYPDYIGGVVSITSKQYKRVNGMSNRFYGWDGANANFLHRLNEHNMKVCRFDPTKNRYHYMYPLPYQRYHVNKFKKEPLPMRSDEDGLNTLHYTEVATVLHPLFTHIMVDL